MNSLSKKILSIGEAADYLGVTEQTLRRWDKDGTFKASMVSAGLHRYYYLADLEKRLKGLLQISKEWAETDNASEPAEEYYCSTSDRFKTRLERLANELVAVPQLEATGSLVGLIAGEVGNNSFDHNLGNWPDTPGVFFACDIGKRHLVLADRGRGVLTTLRDIRPDLQNDTEALRVAFTEIVTGRAPEHRGNGLKSVMSAVYMLGAHFVFQSGDAELAIDGKHKTFTIKPAKTAIRGCHCWLEFR